MKKYIFTILFVFNTFVFAQEYIKEEINPVSKGVYTLSGSISYSSQSYDQVSNSDNTFTFNPQLGYFFINNFYTAISLSYMNHSYSNTSQNYYGIGPAIRYYFNVEKIKPFLGFSFLYNKQTTNSNNNDINSTEWKISGGVDFFLTNNFALETSINYSFINYSISSSSYSSDSKLFQLGVGVNYFIF